MPATAKPEIRGFFDEPTNTVSYLLWDPATKEGAVIDPVLNFDHRSGDATVESADAMLAEAKKLGVNIAQILETHAMPIIFRARPISSSKPAHRLRSANTSRTCSGFFGRFSMQWMCQATVRNLIIYSRMVSILRSGASMPRSSIRRAIRLHACPIK